MKDYNNVLTGNQLGEVIDWMKKAHMLADNAIIAYNQYYLFLTTPYWGNFQDESDERILQPERFLTFALDYHFCVESEIGSDDTIVLGYDLWETIVLLKAGEMKEAKLRALQRQKERDNLDTERKAKLREIESQYEAERHRRANLSQSERNKENAEKERQQNTRGVDNMDPDDFFNNF